MCRICPASLDFATILLLHSDWDQKKACNWAVAGCPNMNMDGGYTVSSHSIKRNVCSVLLLSTVCTFQLHVTLLLCHWPWKDFAKRLHLHGSAHSTSCSWLASNPPLPELVLRIETSFKMACWDQFPGPRQEDGDIKEVRRVTGVSSPNTSILSAPCLQLISRRCVCLCVCLCIRYAE